LFLLFPSGSGSSAIKKPDTFNRCGFPYFIRARPHSLARGDESGCSTAGLLTYEFSTVFPAEEANRLPGVSPVAYGLIQLDYSGGSVEE